MKNDFLCPVMNIVHPSHPGHGIDGFQSLSYALPLGDLFDEIFHLLIAGGVDFIEMFRKLTGERQLSLDDRAMLFQISQVHPPISADVVLGAVRRGNIGIIVIPNFCAGQS